MSRSKRYPRKKLYGYSGRCGHTEVNPQEATVAEFLHRDFLKAELYYTVAANANKAGLRTRCTPKKPRGCEWTDQSAKAVIDRPYIPEGDEYTQPIVSKDLWQACQEVIAKNKGKSRGRRACFVGTGVIHCLKCNERMYGRKAMETYYCKECGNRIDFSVADGLIKNTIELAIPEVNWTGLSLKHQVELTRLHIARLGVDQEGKVTLTTIG